MLRIREDGGSCLVFSRALANEKVWTGGTRCGPERLTEDKVQERCSRRQFEDLLVSYTYRPYNILEDRALPESSVVRVKSFRS